MTSNPISWRGILAIGVAIALCCSCSNETPSNRTSAPGATDAAPVAANLSVNAADHGKNAAAIAAVYKAAQAKDDFRMKPYGALLEAVGSAKTAADLRNVLPNDLLAAMTPAAAWRLLFGEDFNPETARKELESRVVLTVAMASESETFQEKLPPPPPMTVALLRYQKEGDKHGTGQLFFYEDGLWKPHVDDLDADNLVMEDACKARGVIVRDNKIADIAGLLDTARAAK